MGSFGGLGGAGGRGVGEVVDADGGAYLAGDVAEMAMVAEINRLAFHGHVGEKAEGLLGAEIVEGLQDIIGDERHGAVLPDKFEVAGDA